ncbi:MAG: nusA [Anaerolineales bacterium]|nr:nusA [Anaerolineales bacterium]
MKSEFALAFNEISERFGLPREVVMEALTAAMASAYRRAVNASAAQQVEARVDPETGEVHVFAEKEIVESVQNPDTETTLEAAHEVDPLAEMGGMVLTDSTPADFGRVAAQTAKQVILQRLREAERDAQYEEFIEREGDMVHGTVHSITPQAVTVGLGRAEALLPRNQQIPGEAFRVRDRIRVYVLEVRKSSRGPVIVVSRTHPHMLRRLLEMEVPEIAQGLVEIKGIAREAGRRAKVAVAAMRDGVDPVGACVGLRGVRIQSIVRDLNDEKIDVIEWNPDPATFILKALSPARVSGVYLDEDPARGKTALVVVPDDQLSLAIGRAGVNARLAARLTGWRIDIKSLPEAAAESLHRLSTDSEFTEMSQREAETVPLIEAILAKKAETRPVTPEEYQVLTAFNDRIQRSAMEKRLAVRLEQMRRLAEVRDGIPAGAYQTELPATGLPERILTILAAAGFTQAGPVLEALGLDENSILGLEGIGPKSIEEIRETLGGFAYPEIVIPVEEPVVEVEAEAKPEPAAEPAPAPEAVVEPVAEGEPAAAEAVVGEAPAEGTAALEKTFEAIAQELVVEAVEEEDEEKDDADLPVTHRKKKKGKKPARLVEYDPLTGTMVVRHRHKRGDGTFEEG